MFRPNKRRLIILAIIFVFLFGLFLTSAKVQQTAFPGPSQDLFSPASVIYSFILAGILTALAGAFVPLVRLIPKKEQAILTALNTYNGKKPITSAYSIIAIVPGLTKATGYRHVQRLINERVILKDKHGKYLVNKKIML